MIVLKLIALCLAVFMAFSIWITWDKYNRHTSEISKGAGEPGSLRRENYEYHLAQYRQMGQDVWVYLLYFLIGGICLFFVFS